MERNRNPLSGTSFTLSKLIYRIILVKNSHLIKVCKVVKFQGHLIGTVIGKPQDPFFFTFPHTLKRRKERENRLASIQIGPTEGCNEPNNN